MPWRFALMLGLCSMPLFAQSDPLELARGLREMGQADLSLDYLADLAKQNPPAEVALVLPLERAKSLLAVAQSESDSVAREIGVAQAKADFTQFIATNPKHPRVAEAQLALAQVMAVEAFSDYHRARKTSGPNPEETRKRRMAAVALVQPKFREASNLFAKATKNLADQMTAAQSEDRKRELLKTSLQAELDSGINLYRLVQTFENEPSKERGAALEAAKTVFQKLAKKDLTSPICWQARAWEGMCLYEGDDRTAAAAAYKKIKDDAAKSRERAAVDGLRMVEFFEAYAKYSEAGAANDRQQFQNARSQVRRWLDNDRYRPKMTPERLRMTYYYARLTELLGAAEVTYEKPPKDVAAKSVPKIKSVSAQGYQYLKEAARYYKQLVDFENEYSDLANEHRTAAVRLIVGDAPKDPKAYTDLEECQMASVLALMEANKSRAALEDAADKAEGDDAAKKEYASAKAKEKTDFDRTFALMERAKSLIDSKTPPREVAETKLNHVFAYFYFGDYAKAAELGEELARNNRGTLAAQGGYLAIESYLKQREKLGENADSEKITVRGKAVALATFLDSAFPLDLYTDASRLRIGQVLAAEKQYQQAFDLLGKIRPTFGSAATARDLEARCAFAMLVNKETPLDATKKSAIYNKAVADCKSVAMPSSGPALKSYFGMLNTLATLHLVDGKFAEAEKLAVENAKSIAASPLEDAEKKVLGMSAEEAKLRGVLGQAAKYFDEGKYKEMANRMLPVLVELSKSGPATAGVEGEGKRVAAGLDAYRRDFVLFALQGRIREGEFDKAAELFELLEKLGGSVDATTNALERLVSMVRPQVTSLRKTKKDEDANKLSSSIGNLLAKQADKPNLQPRVLASLGRSLRDLGQSEKAVEVLKKVPTPAAEKLFAPTSSIEDENERNAIIGYQIAQIELARAYRALKRFGDAELVLKGALGDEKDPKSRGWAKSMEFKKEAIYLLEDKAFNLPPESRARGWVEAKTGWEKLAGSYSSLLRLPIIDPNDPDFLSQNGQPPKKKGIALNDREKLVPIYLDILFEYRRCLIRANSQIITDPAKLAESYVKAGQAIFELETANLKSLTPELKAKFADLLNDYPAVKEEYKKRGGKSFVEGG